MRRFSFSAIVSICLGLFALCAGIFFTSIYMVTDNETNRRLKYDLPISSEDVDEVIAQYPLLPVIGGDSAYVLAKAYLGRASSKGIFSNDTKADRALAEEYLLKAVQAEPSNPGAWHYLSFLEFLKAGKPSRMSDFYMMSLDGAPRVPYALYQRLFFSGIVLPFLTIEQRKQAMEQIYVAWNWDAEETVIRLPPTLTIELLEEALIHDREGLMLLKESLKK